MLLATVNLAQQLKEAAVISTDGRDVAPGTSWVRASDVAALEAALATVELLAGSGSATQDELDAAQRAVEAATAAFMSARQPGTKGTSSGSGTTGGTTGGTTSTTTNTTNNYITNSGTSGTSGTGTGTGTGTSGTTTSSTTDNSATGTVSPGGTTAPSSGDTEQRELPEDQTPLVDTTLGAGITTTGTDAPADVGLWVWLALILGAGGFVTGAAALVITSRHRRTSTVKEMEDRFNSMSG
jgi:hypothetical protein